jgi:hypothetical protein
MPFKKRTKLKKTDSVNKDIHQIVSDYFHCSSKSELFFDCLIPILVAAVIFIISSFVSQNSAKILDIILKLNSSSINIMAILAGFNTASVAVIASTNKATLNQLYDANQNNDPTSNKGESVFRRFYSMIINQKEVNILKLTISLFCYAIALQLIILILGSLIVVTSDNLIDIYKKLSFINKIFARVVISTCGFIWLSINLHCLFVSLRNVSLLYRYVLFLGSNKDQ